MYYVLNNKIIEVHICYCMYKITYYCTKKLFMNLHNSYMNIMLCQSWIFWKYIV